MNIEKKEKSYNFKLGTTNYVIYWNLVFLSLFALYPTFQLPLLPCLSLQWKHPQEGKTSKQCSFHLGLTHLRNVERVSL